MSSPAPESEPPLKASRQPHESNNKALMSNPQEAEFRAAGRRQSGRSRSLLIAIRLHGQPNLRPEVRKAPCILRHRLSFWGFRHRHYGRFVEDRLLLEKMHLVFTCWASPAPRDVLRPGSRFFSSPPLRALGFRQRQPVGLFRRLPSLHASPTGALGSW